MSEKICKNCGYYGTPKKSSNFALGIGIWFIFIPLAIAFFKTTFVFILCILIPLSYTLYQIFIGTKDVCPSCKEQGSMVSIDSPIGRDLYEKYYINKEK